MINAFGAGNLEEKAVKASQARGMERFVTHEFEFIQAALSFAPIPFETGAHVHTCPDHGDSIFQKFWDEGIIHSAFGDGALLLCFTRLDKLWSE